MATTAASKQMARFMARMLHQCLSRNGLPDKGDFLMRLAILVLTAMYLSAASDMSGKWTIAGDVMGNPVNLNCSIQQNAEAKIAGMCEINGTPVEIAGDVKDTEFKFSL